MLEYATVFQAAVYAILACVHETETQGQPEKLLAFALTVMSEGAVKTTSPLVQQCQQALNDSSTRHAVYCCILGPWV
jgi:hypothetical protein